MNQQKAEQLRRRLMGDHDSEPDKLTNVVDELRALQESSDRPEELVERYRRASSEIIDFFDRLQDLAVSEAESSGDLINFSDFTASQILLACVRGYPDYRRSFEGTNGLLNEEMERSRALEQQILEVSLHYEGIIQGLRPEA
jgi:hypothetical protein